MGRGAWGRGRGGPRGQAARRGAWRWSPLAAAVVVLMGLACTRTGRQNEAPPPSPSSLLTAREAIEHLAPPRDYKGLPSRFEWTRVTGADRYAIHILNEIGLPVWRQSDLQVPSVDWPADVELESGTYFWAVTAFRGNEALAESGVAAFVVLR